MSTKELLVNLAKLIACGLTFVVGTIIGGMLAIAVNLPRPTLPAGADATGIVVYEALSTPLLALALALLARGLGGNFITRASALSFLTWIAYTVNTQLEASIFTAYAAGFWFSVVDFALAAVLCGTAVAFLFPPERTGAGLMDAARSFFARRSPLDWTWRLALAAVAFMPIYFLFGLMVVPFTGEYYRQNLFGLTMPTIEQILPILFVRSILFLLAGLPILILWQKSERSLLWRLGFALYVLVGLLGLLVATWMPLYVRVPHALEILADEFVYAGVLVVLLARGNTETQRAQKLVQQRTTA